jgi:cytochrome c-type biogenesis protein CcmE
MVAISLVIYALKNNINLYFTPSELSAKNLQHKIRLGGVVKPQSFKRFKGLELEFIVTDYKNEILVRYTGVLPDLFKEGQGVVVLGTLILTEKGYVFEAQQILAKHDEKYTPPL